MNNTYYTYPAIFYHDEDGIAIEFPDLPGCCPCAQSEDEAYKNASEALGVHLFGMEQDGDAIPRPTSVWNIHPEDGGVVVLVRVYMPSIRYATVTRSVTRTVTLPAWLNAAACERNVNFSQVLQDALKQQLHLG